MKSGKSDFMLEGSFSEVAVYVSCPHVLQARHMTNRENLMKYHKYICLVDISLILKMQSQPTMGTLIRGNEV